MHEDRPAAAGSPALPDPAGLTVDGALQSARIAGLERLDAQWLLSDLLERSRAWLLAHGDQGLSPSQAITWTRLLARHAAGEPLAYLLGWAEFRGLRLRVNAAVLIPRSDTEVLVDWALERLGTSTACEPAPKVLDLGTGSGAVALAVKQAWPAADVTATDASSGALALAAENGQALALAVRWCVGDWWSAAPPGSAFDLVLSNPPYIAEDDRHLDALRHEPLSALAAGRDGLDDLRRIVAGAPAQLVPGGWLLLEHGWTQAAAVSSLLAESGFTAIDTRTDLAGRPRCTGGRWPGRGSPAGHPWPAPGGHKG